MAEQLGGYVRDVAKTLAALRGAGAGVKKASERGQPLCVADERVILRLHW